MSTALSLLDHKISVPSDMRTAEWAMVPQWLRERSFYMAGVSQAEILHEFRGEARKIAEGTSDFESSRKRLEAMLAATGYKPLPGQEKTIKDLTTARRMYVSLTTNVNLLQGWSKKERGMRPGEIDIQPAWELVRVKSKMVPRVWADRFVDAGGTVQPDGKLMAMKHSIVWAALGNKGLFEDAIGVDYPPFAWGSGMGWMPVRRADAEARGLIPAGWMPPYKRPVASPNESLQTVPRISERALREELTERMRAMAEWQGDKFIFTDPNGTRRMPAEDLLRLWERGMPEAFEALPGKGLLQREAVVRWLSDHAQFQDKNARDAWDDLQRLAGRLDSAPVDRLWRGMSMSKDKLDAFLRELGATYRTREDYPLESWTGSRAAANAYARTGGKGWSVVLEVAHPRQAANISALARALTKDVSKQPSPPLATENEWIYTTGRSFKIVKTKRDDASRTVHLTLEELP